MFARFCIIALGSLPDAPAGLFPLSYSIPFYFQASPLVFLLVCFHLSNVGWESWLLFGLLKGIRDNITTNELLNGHRYDYLQHSVTGAFYNPFNRGNFISNLKDLITPSVDWHHLYHLPSRNNNNQHLLC